jgi:DNA-binding protein YbaB
VETSVDDELRAHLARLQDLAAGYQIRLGQVTSLWDRARQVTATARSQDGLVSVEVGAHGQLLVLQLDPGTHDQLRPDQLAAVIAEAAQAAAADAAGQVLEIMAPVLPSGAGLARGTPPTLDTLRDRA